MKTIYELYDALLTIKDTAPLDWKLVESTQRLYE